MDDIDSDICADELSFGIDPEMLDFIKKATPSWELVYQILVGADYLNWIDLYNEENKDTDVCSFIASFNDAMINEMGESIFDKPYQVCLRTLPFLFIEAKKRFETLSSVNASSDYVKNLNDSVGRKESTLFIPFKRQRDSNTTPYDYGQYTRPMECARSKHLTINREPTCFNDAVSDYRTRRLSPGLGPSFKGPPEVVPECAEANTVAELWAINAQLRPISKLIQAIEGDSHIRDRVAWLTFAALNSRLTSINSIRSQMKHISDLIKFTISKYGSISKLEGHVSSVIIRDFLIDTKERGHSVPLAARSAITTWGDTLQMDWRCSDHLVKSAVLDLTSRKVAQAPPFPLNFLVRLEKLVEQEDMEIGLLLFASAILLTVHASLRFSDIQRISTFTETEDVIHGSLTACKVRKQHGLPWPFAALRMGFTNKRSWHRPIMDFRQAYYQNQRVLPTFTIPKINDAWVIEEFVPATYNMARKRLLMLAILMNDETPERYTLHSGKNFYPTCGGQLRMEREKRNKLGHWATLSSMAERYDRSTCSTELQLRSDILKAISEGWAPVKSFEIPKPPPQVNSG